MPKALIAMSGGVDSAVAALLTLRAGYECIGATMRLFDGETGDGSCCSLEDVEDAKSVARLLGIPHYTFNFSDSFDKEVISRFVAAYGRGETPNPCIDCNRFLKFGSLFRRAEELGCDVIVTGHYARVERDGATGRALLKKGIDPGKDQSYVLYGMTPAQLERTFLPLGGMTKDETRLIAEQNGFINARKRDSQDICFVPDGDYASFIERYTGEQGKPGDFVDVRGNVLGRHRGCLHYTIGQRRGIGLAFDRPMYVGAIDTEANTVTLCEDRELYRDTLTAGDVNLISVDGIEDGMRVKARIRYRHTEQPATVSETGDGGIKVVFDEPQRAITPGQAVVLYDGDVVVGGGVIR